MSVRTAKYVKRRRVSLECKGRGRYFERGMTVTIQLPSDIEAALLALARAQAWREAARGLPHTAPLSDEAISREHCAGRELS